MAQRPEQMAWEIFAFGCADPGSPRIARVLVRRGPDSIEREPPIEAALSRKNPQPRRKRQWPD